jgi:hypothetical protein
MEYKQQFTAFIDLLGFSEASRDLDEPARRAVHALLLSLANMRSNFAVSVESAAVGRPPRGDCSFYGGWRD